MLALLSTYYVCATCGQPLEWEREKSPLEDICATQRALLRHPYGGIIDRTAQGWTPCPHRNKLFSAPVEFVELKPIEGVPHVEPDTDYPV